MNLSKLMKPFMTLSVVGLLFFVLTLPAEPQDVSAPNAKEEAAARAKSKVDEHRVDEAIARDRAKLMHEVYSATLDVIHHRYFHRETSTIPARAMEDIFREMKHQSQVQARWISVNTKAMSLDHEPATDFEKHAAAEIASGKEEVDIVEDGYYRRAGAITLGSGCLRCHEGLFQATTNKPRYAGLVISVPIKTVPANPTDTPKAEPK